MIEKEKPASPGPGYEEANNADVATMLVNDTPASIIADRIKWLLLNRTKNQKAFSRWNGRIRGAVTKLDIR
jgi:hypothetical protein